MISRRQILRTIGAAAAAELWLPGERLISIPSGRIWTRADQAFERSAVIMVSDDAEAWSLFRASDLERHREEIVESVSSAAHLIELVVEHPSGRGWTNSRRFLDHYARARSITAFVEPIHPTGRDRIDLKLGPGDSIEIGGRPVLYEIREAIRSD